MQKWLEKSLSTQAPSAVALVRVLVGSVFLSEGIQKFLYPLTLGTGRFAKIGFPAPEWVAFVVGVFEIVCGSFVISGLLTRLASVPLLVIIITAIATTKLPMLAHQGFWAMLHEARADWCMFLGSIFLIIVGGGRWSLDAFLAAE